MRYRFLTPHQFHPLSSFVDTWIVSTFSPWPLDIAVPTSASQFIVFRMAELVKERFMGRSAEMDLGSALVVRGLDPSYLSDFLHSTGQPIRFAVVLVDRVLLREEACWTDSHGITWLVIDWWQWFRHRLPQNRAADAWLYLCLCNPFYRSSHEFRRTGIQPEAAASMAEQGEQLLTQFVSYVCESITALWRTAPESSNHSWNLESDQHSHANKTD